MFLHTAKQIYRKGASQSIQLMFKWLIIRVSHSPLMLINVLISVSFFDTHSDLQHILQLLGGRLLSGSNVYAEMLLSHCSNSTFIPVEPHMGPYVSWHPLPSTK